MEKLFDETYGAIGDRCRTIWYGYYEGDLNNELKDKFIALIKSDLADPPEDPIASTNWVFYDKKEQKDAISDSPRASFMVRFKNNEYVANFNMSDFQFVMAFDAIEAFKNLVVNELN